ncbi:MAG TPA: glycosyltransferase family 9 protein [Candidatus Kapabacteria bacterium]|nr:glycosyltransferase family 9 protein [Candidatus Kapabacteria bacterium]
MNITSKPKKILIVRTDKIGDMVLTLPLARAIKQVMPDANVSIMARTYTAPLVKLCPDIDKVVEYDGSSFVHLIGQLRRVRADVVILLSPKARFAIASFLAGIPIRIGKGYRWYSVFTNKKIFEHRKNAERNEAAYNLRMLKPLGIDAEEQLLPILDKNKLPKNPINATKYIVLHTQTGGSAPIWDADKWCKLGSVLNQKFHLPVILTGIRSEGEFLFILSERMKQDGMDVHILPESDLLSLARVLSEASLVISGSTGPGHIAAALGAPTIGLFPLARALSKERWGFRGANVENLSPLDPVKAECPMCKNCECIAAITVDQVMNAGERLIRP